MPIYYNEDQKTVKKMANFMNASRKLTSTKLNRQPAVSNDYFDDPKLDKSPRGLAHGRPVDDRLINKPISIRKKVSEQKGGKQQTKLTASKKKAGLNKPNKGMVKKYK